MKEWPNAAIVVVFVAVLIVITGCARQPVQAEDTSSPRGGIEEHSGAGVRVYQDPDTGCEYLITSRGGITPRMEDKAGRSGISNPQKGCSYN